MLKGERGKKFFRRVTGSADSALAAKNLLFPGEFLVRNC